MRTKCEVANPAFRFAQTAYTDTLGTAKSSL